MIILDTNILSELIKPGTDPNVLAWFDRLEPQTLTTTAITAAEIGVGLKFMTDGKRKRQLEKAYGQILQTFTAEILPFDLEASRHYAALSLKLKKQGTPIGQNDTMIAAIVHTHQATLVTHNTKHFTHCGIEVVDPFTASV